MRTLIIGDSHIKENNIDELTKVFQEIFEIKADKVIHTGDFYDNNKLSPKELQFGTSVAIELKRLYSDVTILSGNGRHEWLNGVDIISYLKNLNIKCPGMEKIEEIDNKKCFFGHYMTNESYKEYGSHDYTVADLMKYDYVILGHQHNPQEIRKGKIYHIGSMFYQHFNESTDEYKRVALIEDGELKFIPLKTPLPMIDVHSINELKDVPTNAKVRLIFSSFAQFKREVPKVKEWKNKFSEFKTKLDFETQVAKPELEKSQSKSKKSLEAILNEELIKIEDNEVRELLVQQFKENPNE